MSLNLDLEHQIGNIKVPEIDIHDQVMYKISAKKQNSFTLNTKVLIASIISLLVIVGTGFASSQIIILYNEKGKEMFTVEPYVENSNIFAIDEYSDLIEEGEALAVYSPDKNGHWDISPIVKPFLFDDWKMFLETINNTFPIDQSFINTYTFKEGRVSYLALIGDPTSLIEESKEKGNIVTYKKIELSDTIGHLTINVEKNNYEYNVSISPSEYTSSITSAFLPGLNEEKQTQKFKLEGTEGFITKVDDQTFAMWKAPETQGSILYTVSSKNTTSSADEEIKSILLSLTQK